MNNRAIPLILIIFLVLPLIVISQSVVTFEDVMKFKEIRHPVISGNGEWIAFGVWPERGDGEVRIKKFDGSNEYIVDRGERPQMTNDGNWAAAIVQPHFIDRENARKDPLRTGLELIKTSEGSVSTFEEVQYFEFSNNSRWLIIRHHRPKELDEHAKKNKHIGTPVTLVQLNTGSSQTIQFVNESAIDSSGRYFVYGVVDTTGKENGMYAMDLLQNIDNARKFLGGDNAYYNNITWDNPRLRVAFTESVLDSTNEYDPLDASIIVWQATQGDVKTILDPDLVPDGYRLRTQNNLQWTKDGHRLFYGLMLDEMVQLDEKKEKSDSLTVENLYDPDFILNDVSSDVWHWDDPLIKTNERQTWNRRKNHLYKSVYHFDTGESVQLATENLPEISDTQNPHVILGTSILPYRKLITWDGRYNDVYLIDLKTGEQKLLFEMMRFTPTLSPNGQYIAYFLDNEWFLYNVEHGSTLNLTANIGVPFDNEDNDQPMPAWPYGIAGWTDDDRAVLIYDKYDIWQFDTQSGNAVKLTDGRGEKRIFRIRNLNPDSETFAPNEELLLEMYYDLNKNFGFYRGRIGRRDVTRLIEDDVKYSFVAKAEHNDRILFTVERYDTYPNLWIASDKRFRDMRKITHLYDDLTERFAWGQAELISWLNFDGKDVQGVLIYPGNYEKGKRYPILVYYYERFSQRLHEFNHPYTNHRPVFAQYASDGYAVFLPDIWFDVPIPGYSATKNLVPGVKKLIEMGVADPKAIGLHGHSWSGYLTAHVVTQTDIFAAAVAGAPVSNMTSAYSGIRWGTGLARQFQYEQAQSRLGVSMYENRAPYIENSPVFFADRINTPLLIQFGDKDEAVPWEQGIELYLALRRLEKDAIFLQYHDEPHHLQKYANRLDYSIKMKEYFDYYLKGITPPGWITEGIQYRGN
jgi:dipeptidyl aminopeptidase/acylaminoacyl peptidase